MTFLKLISAMAFLFAIACVMSSESGAEEGGLRLLSFRVAQLTVLQPGGATSFSGEAGWNPYYGFGEKLGIRGNFGGMLLKGNPGTLFAAEYEALLAWSIIPALGIEAGGGAQTWFSGGTSPVLSVGTSWKFDSKFLGLIDHVFAGYSAFLIPGTTTQEIKAGIGISF